MGELLYKGTVTTSGTITLSNAGVRSITQDSSDGHKLTINTNGTSSTITMPISEIAITSEYSELITLIKYIYNNHTDYSFPLTIQKSGTTSISDVPFSTKTTEWNAIIFGNYARMSIMITNFAQISQTIYTTEWFNTYTSLTWNSL